MYTYTYLNMCKYIHYTSDACETKDAYFYDKFKYSRHCSTMNNGAQRYEVGIYMYMYL
jgi:hypothetical protein